MIEPVGGDVFERVQSDQEPGPLAFEGPRLGRRQVGQDVARALDPAAAPTAGNVGNGDCPRQQEQRGHDHDDTTPRGYPPRFTTGHIPAAGAENAEVTGGGLAPTTKHLGPLVLQDSYDAGAAGP